MKKIILLFILVTTLFSCSDNDDAIVSASVLQKVVFYRDSPNERQWIIENGLLANITLADGTVAEEFVYDSQNRVIRDVKYTSGIATETTVITYNADDTINTINGLPYTYNASTRTYAYSYGSSFTINCQVNSDFLAVNYTRTGTNPGQYHMAYANGDMTSFEKITNSTTDTLKNFHFDGVYGANPIYASVLSVARVKSLTDPSFFIDCHSSINMANGFDKGTSDPYYYNYGELPNMDGKLFEFGIEVLDSSNNAVDFYSFADYYYQ